MGKIPPSFRSAISTSIVPKPKPTDLPKSDTFSPKKPHPNFPKKTPKSKPKPPPNPNSLPAIRSPKILFDSPKLSEAKTLFDSLLASPKSPNLDRNFYNSVLQSYSSISTLQDSFSLLNHMVKTSPPFVPDHSTFHILLMKACSLPDSRDCEFSLAEVHKVLNFMVNNEVSPGKATADVAVKSLVSADRLDCAVELVKDLSSKGCLPDTYTYNFVVKSLCKGSSVSSAHSFIDQMRTWYGVKPDLVTYTILIDNVCNTRNLREATRLLGVLNEEGFKPDCFVYNTIMKGYCTLSRGSEVVEVYNKMKEEGVVPDSVTYNTLIFGLSKSGRVKDAKKYLEVMVREGHLPDAVTYTSLMNGMCRQGDVLGALRLLGEMSEDNGCSPNACTYNTLLHGLSKARLLDQGMELYQVMKAGEMKLDTAAYATMVRSLCRSGRVAEAYEVFDYAVESKSLTDVAAYSTLESTLKWLKKAREQGLAT